ncbi:MAG: hypothetical protein M3Q70_01845 [bacterium]|nr:hypothetical protein [bacterium]
MHFQLSPEVAEVTLLAQKTNTSVESTEIRDGINKISSAVENLVRLAGLIGVDPVISSPLINAKGVDKLTQKPVSADIFNKSFKILGKWEIKHGSVSHTNVPYRGLWLLLDSQIYEGSGEYAVSALLMPQSSFEIPGFQLVNPLPPTIPRVDFRRR